MIAVAARRTLARPAARAAAPARTSAEDRREAANRTIVDGRMIALTSLAFLALFGALLHVEIVCSPGSDGAAADLGATIAHDWFFFAPLLGVVGGLATIAVGRARRRSI